MALKCTAADLANLDNLVNNTTEKREFVKVPCGDYEVRLHSVKCKTYEPDDYHTEEFERAIITFQILNGEYEGEYITYMQNLDKVWQIKIVNLFLKSMKTYTDLSSSRYVVDGDFKGELYHAVLEEVYDDVTARGLEYQLNVSPQDKNPKYNKYTIVNVFDE